MDKRIKIGIAIGAGVLVIGGIIAFVLTRSAAPVDDAPEEVDPVAELPQVQAEPVGEEPEKPDNESVELTDQETVLSTALSSAVNFTNSVVTACVEIP